MYLEEGDHALDEVMGAEVPGDTLAALQLLRAQFPQLPGRPVAPLVLRSQVYSVVRDRTAVDRELDELRCGSLKDCLCCCAFVGCFATAANILYSGVR